MDSEEHPLLVSSSSTTSFTTARSDQSCVFVGSEDEGLDQNTNINDILPIVPENTPSNEIDDETKIKELLEKLSPKKPPHTSQCPVLQFYVENQHKIQFMMLILKAFVLCFVLYVSNQLLRINSLHEQCLRAKHRIEPLRGIPPQFDILAKKILPPQRLMYRLRATMGNALVDLGHRLLQQ